MMLEQKVTEFIEILGSSAPVPGGGGASAAVGAFSAALGRMVANLTIGKKKYADVSEEVEEIEKKLKCLQDQLVQFTDKDAEAFLPLSAAYKLPKGEERDLVMEEALYGASLVPLMMMEQILEVMKCLEVLGEKGSALAMSDVGIGILFGQAALEGASLNIYVNAGMMKQRERAEELVNQAGAFIEAGKKIHGKTYPMIVDKIKRE